MEVLTEPIRERLPQDLPQYILKQKTIADIPICEQEPANVAFEIITAGAFEMTAYFPVSSNEDCCLHASTRG